MAPEQIQGNVPISRKTDLYATGCLLYEVLTGETPFVSENPAEMLMQHLNDDPYNVREKIPECPLALDALIERLLAKNPDDRPYDALAVHTELTEILKKAQEVVSSASPEALAATGASGTASVDPATGDVKPKKKKKKDKSEFYERTWFLVTCLILLIAAGIWLAMGPGEDTLYLKAKDAMSNPDTVAQFDAKRLYLLPYLEQYPDGKYANEVHRWLDDVEVKLLEAQVDRKAKGNRDGRNQYETRCIRAFRAERDKEKNPLEAIELFQDLINSLASVAASAQVPAEPDSAAEPGDVAGDPKYWRMLAERHLTSLRQALLDHAERIRFITERMTVAEKLQADGKSEEARKIFSLFRDAFRGERDLDPWLDYARSREDGSPAPMPTTADKG
jgi:serine/threonine-protein kinase